MLLAQCRLLQPALSAAAFACSNLVQSEAAHVVHQVRMPVCERLPVGDQPLGLARRLLQRLSSRTISSSPWKAHHVRQRSAPRGIQNTLVLHGVQHVHCALHPIFLAAATACGDTAGRTGLMAQNEPVCPPTVCTSSKPATLRTGCASSLSPRYELRLRAPVPPAPCSGSRMIPTLFSRRLPAWTGSAP